MALRLRIVSDHRRTLAERSTVVFGAAGGTIGRSADNDWVLPDSQRYISAHHARVLCRQDGYFLEDLSTNGVYVNDGERPLDKQSPYRLRNGDLLRLGEYHVVVAIESLPAAGPGTVIPVVEAVPTSIQALRTVGKASQTDIGAALNLDDLLMGENAPADSFRLVNAFGQAVAGSPRPAYEPDEEPDDEVVQRRIARLAKAAARSRERDAARSPNVPTLHDVQTGLQAFCRGAGIDAERLPSDAQSRLLHLVGQLFREALVGLKDLERTQQDIRNRLQTQLPENDDPRPSLTRQTIEDVLVDILSQHESRRLDAVLWLRETIDAAKTHDTATEKATRAAFADFIGRLNPTELETRFQRPGKKNLLPGSANARNWELFSEFYRNLCEMPADSLPRTFVDAFAATYVQLSQARDLSSD